MNSDKFSELQPIAFQIISNSIRNKHFAHAYLLYGNETVPLQDYAQFLIQSLLCEEPQAGLACGKCNNCQRVAKDIYADLVILSGAEKRIKKEQILELMNQLNKTGLEHKNIKFYLINEAENATEAALNSLLKFLEEPGNESTYAILTTHQVDRVLPTIVSRCLKVPFWGNRNDSVSQQLFSDEDNSVSYLVRNMAKGFSNSQYIKDDENFNRAINTFRLYLKSLFINIHESLVLVERAGFVGDSNKDKEFLGYWLALNIQFFKDLNYTNDIPLGWYKDFVDSYQNQRIISIKMLPIFLSAYDQLNKPLNLKMLVERTFWQLKEIT